MPAINNDQKWEVSGRGMGVTCLPPPTRSLPSSPPRIEHLKRMSLSAMLGEYHRDEMHRDLPMTSSLPCNSLQGFRAMGESIEMTNDLLDLSKPLPWDRLKRGASTMSLDSLNENYMESVPGEMAVLEDQDKTPVATCTCGKTTNFECWVHRVPFSGAGELTEEISQTCLQLVKELRSEPSGCDGVINDPSYENKHDYGGLDLHLKDSPPTNHVRESVDTPCSWKKERVSTNDLVRDLDTPSSKSSGSLASAPSIHRSELSSSPDSYDLLYKSFEVAAEMDRLQLERGQSEGSSVGSSLESLNRTSPKLQKVLSQKRRSSPDGSGESPTDVASCDSITGSQKNLWLALQPQYNPQPLTLDTYRYEVIHKEDTCSNDTSQKVTFASLAKKKKKPEVTTSQVLPSEVTHWTELVTLGLPKEESCLQPHTSPISSSKCEAGNKSKRPHSLPIQLRHIQKPSSRPQQTPEQSQQGNTGGAPAGIKGVTRTVSAPEGFACSFPRSAGSGQDLSLTKMTSWVVPAASQSTSSVSLLTRKRHYNQHYHTTPQLDPTIGCEGSTDPKMAAGSPLINSSMQDSGHGMRDLSYPLGYDSNAQMPVRATRARIFAMDINANFTEPQEQDTFIPEHHHFIPQEITSETGNLHRESPTSSRVILGNPLQDRLHFRSNLGVESSADWVPGPRTTWLDTNRRTVIPPRTLNLITQEEVRPLQKKAKELQTCSRGCSTNSPPEVDPTSFLRMYPRTYKENELMAKDQTKECKDVGVSTDETLNGKGGCFCPCAKNYHHIADINQSTQTLELRDQSSQSDLPSRCLLDSGDRSESGNISKIVKGESLDKGSQVGLCQDAKDQSRLDKRTLEKSVQGSKAGRKSKPKVRQGKDCTKKAVPTETSVQSWRVGGKGRRGSRTIVTCEESHVADALTNRVVRIQNVGASTLPASADKKYIRHRPLKPIHQVDAEHQQRKVLQKLCGNADQPVAPLPPTVIAWPGLQDSMHSRADRVNSLPADLSQYRSWGTAASNPQPGQSQPLSSAGVSTAGQPIKRILSWESGAERHSIDEFQLDANGTSLKGRPLSLDVSSDYDVGADCLPPQEMQVSPREAKEEVDLVQKKALVTAVEGAVEHILSHFGQAKTKSLEEKGRLGSTALTPDIGHLMLHYLCPAIRALLLDGLQPHVTSFFVGRLKTTLWGVVEATTQLGPGTRPLHELVRQLSQLAYLKTSDLRVNAFIMGLLNIRCLELWLEHIRDHPDIVRNLYEPNAFLSLCNGATKAFFDRLLIAIQPLTLLPFDLDYKFEHQGLVHELNQQREKQQLMDRYGGKPNSSTLLTQSHTSVGGSWLKGTASLLWKNWEGTQKPEEPASSGTMTSSLGFLRNIKGQRSVERTKNSRSSEQPVSGMLKTDENSTPTQGVDPTRDSFSNKEASNSWSLEWIKGFVAASTEATTSNAGVSSTKNMTSSGSTWSRFGSSLSKAFDRIRPDSIATTTQRQPVRQEWPSRTSDKETISPKQVASPRKMESPSSPVAPGSPVKARCHHVTMSKEQLSFTKGSILTVQQQVDPDWLMCSQGDQSGLVHIDYVQGME
ncbi:uncharacterized protein LOC110989218 isoform X2 [Acanthaster planci]|uniref:Uncharacterized protein LOC110989218 isoform X2 n=1 Tax=Acanthaster planci TaxID=133434 RepID=A0A8B7ZZX0_ACAPL|nr:uncharacterized protein LOC110989218 isoform X2 [Acanthaster planci]